MQPVVITSPVHDGDFSHDFRTDSRTLGLLHDRPVYRDYLPRRFVGAAASLGTALIASLNQSDEQTAAVRNPCSFTGCSAAL